MNTPFSGMGGIKANASHGYMPFGFAGIVSIVSLTGKTNRKGIPSFIVEFCPVTSNHPEAPVGARLSWAINMQEPAKALAEIKAFLLAVMGQDSAAFEKAAAAGDPNAQALNAQIDALCARALQADNPLAGRKVYLTTKRKRTRAGGDFTVHTWAPEASAPAVLPAPTPADLAPRNVAPGAPGGYAPGAYGVPPGGYPAQAPAYAPPGAPTWQGAPPPAYPPQGAPPGFAPAPPQYPPQAPPPAYPPPGTPPGNPWGNR